MRVICLGDLMVDVLASLPTELEPGTDTPAPISLLGGGSAANTAAWLVAAGMPTTFVGRVGDDALGRMAVDELASAGLDLEVSIDPKRATGMCIVLIDADAERTMVPSGGANAGLGEAALDPELFAAGRHLHVSAYALFQAGARPAVDRAVELARAAAMTVSVDAASAAPLRKFGVRTFLDWLPRCLLFANLDEAVLLAGSDEPEHAARTLAQRCGEAVVKLGAHGAIWSDGDEVRREYPRPVAVIDSTGAGDAFAAGVLAGRLRGDSVTECLRAGTALAARAIGAVGARPPRSPW